VLQSAPVEVGGEDGVGAAVDRLREEDGEGIGFNADGAAGAPDAQFIGAGISVRWILLLHNEASRVVRL